MIYLVSGISLVIVFMLFVEVMHEVLRGPNDDDDDWPDGWA